MVLIEKYFRNLMSLLKSEKAKIFTDTTILYFHIPSKVIPITRVIQCHGMTIILDHAFPIPIMGVKSSESGGIILSVVTKVPLANNSGEETRGVLKVFLENVIRKAVKYTEHAKRKTATAMDVVYSLKKLGLAYTRRVIYTYHLEYK
ncbi:Histone H4 [Armadillidium nasatum]|uniref:Histone H4 n=1 Tax=Armadillidium nasatum TaxID=96803 RepID=A0A5N5SJ13_9CRUS|nr:Histone H4 [Armadillidium nasatum]